MISEKYEIINTEINTFNPVYNTIYYGSIYQAIINNYLSVNEILVYLIDAKVDYYTMIAYKNVCMFSLDQILSTDNDYNDRPFLVINKNIEYVYIHASYQFSIPGRNDKERFEIMTIINKQKPDMLLKNNLVSFITMLSDNIAHFKIKRDKMWILIGGRCFNILSSFPQLKYNPEVLLDFDFMILLNDFAYNKYEKMLLKRCDTLRKMAPGYWKNVAKDLYIKLIKKNVNVKNPIMTRFNLKKYIELFPGLFPDEIVNVSDMVYNLRKLRPVVQAYVLGFPIHQYIPSSGVIKESIQLLDDVGLEKYCEKLKNKTIEWMKSETNCIGPTDKSISIYNQEDVLMEEISNYNKYDIISYYIDTHLYFFTRPEFPNLIESHKNPWTNSHIPLTILCTINNRLESATIIEKLPPAAPISELLKRVGDGNLYNPDSGLNNDDSSSDDGDSSDHSDYNSYDEMNNDYDNISDDDDYDNSSDDGSHDNVSHEQDNRVRGIYVENTRSDIEELLNDPIYIEQIIDILEGRSVPFGTIIDPNLFNNINSDQDVD